MLPTLALPIAVIALGAAACVLVRRRPAGAPHAAPAAAPTDVGTPS
ncbi:hypothetical protein [Actinomadura sp. J1-007]|nr:hypothetical protein [Actinomadura sp. J1-007]